MKLLAVLLFCCFILFNEAFTARIPYYDLTYLKTKYGDVAASAGAAARARGAIGFNMEGNVGTDVLVSDGAGIFGGYLGGKSDIRRNKRAVVYRPDGPFSNPIKENRRGGPKGCGPPPDGARRKPTGSPGTSSGSEDNADDS